ncbi:MAG TPA: VOC family protein, partial [Solirubrobacteraceae bacterium]|nr:VOC family protein [Solirubrobacteraceae bacterium]
MNSPAADLEHVAAQNLPAPGTINLDHVAHFVPHMDAASTSLDELGFILTPFSPQSNRNEKGEVVPAGTANRVAMLERGYFEILTPIADTPLAKQLRDAMTRHSGQHLIAFGTPVAEEEHARLERHGFAPLPLVNLQREVDVSGEKRLTRFSVVRVAPETMPEGRVQFCQHHTPECMWQPRYVRQPNGVTGLLATFVVAEEPEEVAARF